MAATLRLLGRLGWPLLRRDIWFLILLFYPLILILTWSTWDLWHPSSREILAAVHVYSPIVVSPTCSNTRWLFDVVKSLPAGVPGIYPAETVPVELIEPLLQSSNLALLLYTGWGTVVTLTVLAFLLPYWSIDYARWALFKDVSDLEKATHILVQANGKNGIFCPLRTGMRFKDKYRKELEEVRVISYLKKTFCVAYARSITAAADQERLVKRLKKYKTVGLGSANPLALFPLQYDMTRRLSFYRDKLLGPGLIDQNDVVRHRKVFGLNEQDIPIPSFIELFGEHARAPLFVFQIFCVLLWLIDEYWQYSLMTLGILVLFEGQMVVRRRKDLGMIKGMHMPPIPLAVKRNGAWYAISSRDLLPGDVFSLGTNVDLTVLPRYPGLCALPIGRYSGDDQSISCPCDAVLLSGSAIVNEAMLTGESLPQMKTAVDFTGVSENDRLSIQGKNRASVLFAGTSVLTEQGEKDKSFDGAVCYCLRTGFQTTQGKLIRTVLYSSERATAASTEAMWFLLILLVVAISASGYVLHQSWGLPNRNHFKLLLHCVMIITSVVPPELPVTMSMTVTLALAGLFKKKLYCTEPFRIPAAGKLTICCFDKTGTLTSSEVILEAVVGLPRSKSSKNELFEMSYSILDDPRNFHLDTWEASKDKSDVKPVALELPQATRVVMACCHSLVAVNRRRKVPQWMRTKGAEVETQILGDPLERTAMEKTGWKPRVGRTEELVGPNNGSATILRRFAFASEHQRMTVVCKFPNEHGQMITYVVCKGAAERLGTLLAHVPDWYYETVEKLALNGRRVLVLGCKVWGDNNTVHKASREQLENGLRFCGILVYGCPIKPKTKETLSILRQSGHGLMMITGDDPRTAAYIAVDTGLTPAEKDIFFVRSITDSSDKCVQTLVVESRDKKRTTQLQVHCSSPVHTSTLDWFHTNALALTGKNIAALRPATLNWIIPHTAIFSRVTPKDKEFILRILAAQGETTLMCGDGTNDVGALKAAHVGISLLNFDIDKIKQNKKRQLDSIAQRQPIAETLEQSRKRRLDLGLSAKQIAHLEKVETNLRQQEAGMSLLPNKYRDKLVGMMRKTVATTEENMAQGNLAKAAGHQTAANSALKDVSQALEDEMPLLKPGDASMASPFTYRGQNIKCVKLLVRSGKGTLATVMMMYKLMALNSLTTAFSLSVLTFNGIKFGDRQTTVESLFISALFMAASNARSAKKISHERVIDSLFDPYFYTSIILQSLVHIGTCSAAWWLAAMYGPASTEMDGPFKANLVNTVIWLLSAAQHAASFTANYEGDPFLISMKDNKVLHKGLMVFIGALFFIACESLPILNSALQLVPFPSPTFRYAIVALIGLDLSLSTAVGKYCTAVGRNKRTQALRRDL